MKKIRKIVMREIAMPFGLAMTLTLLFSPSVFAQAGAIPSVVGAVPGQALARPLVLLFILAGLALLPFIIMMTTSFVKIAVVLSLVRNALGTQQIPPNPVITGLAMILTLYIMTPVGLEIYKTTGQTVNQGTNQPMMSEVTVNLLVQALKESKEPVRNFLMKHAHEKERLLFYNLAKKMRTPEDRDKLGEKDLDILVPAFVISELSEAFQIGFIIFLPFLVIDIVVTNILLSLGMFQISPVTVALPFKLLLFVLVDGWHLIAKGLVMGYI